MISILKRRIKNVSTSTSSGMRVIGRKKGKGINERAEREIMSSGKIKFLTHYKFYRL